MISSRACESAIGTFRNLGNRLNERLLIDARLSYAEIFDGPFDDIRKVELCSGAEANAPFPPSHSRKFYPAALEMIFSEEVVQIGLQVFAISKFFEFASIQCTNAEASRCA